MEEFDLVVLGTGSAASTVASRTRAAGWRVAVVDSRPFGGTCALRGCDPKRVLIGAAELVDWRHRMRGKGVAGPELEIDWPELMRFKRSFTAPVPEQKAEGFKRAGIAAYHGPARFVDATTVRVGEAVLRATHVVVATGMKPADLEIAGGDHLITSERFLELDALPREPVIIGGGYIAFEFAHVAGRAGARVTIVHRGARPLSRFDPDLVAHVVARTRALGVRIELGAEVHAIEATASRLLVRARSRDGALRLEGDAVVHAAGRVPEIEDLDLEKAGIEFDRRGVRVNEFLQSPSNPAVYAAGDAAATAGPPLSPVAGYEGRIVADNLLAGNHRQADYSGIPTVLFTVPPLAAVGMLEEEAQTRGLRFRTRTEDMSGWYSSRRVGATTAAAKVLIAEGSERILGAHLLGPGAEELINLFALAIRRGIPATELKDAIFAYPTHGADLRSLL